jgi:hypothetical protein
VSEKATAEKDVTEKTGMEDGVADQTPAGKPVAGRSQDSEQDGKMAALPDPSAPAPPSPVGLAKSLQPYCAGQAA